MLPDFIPMTTADYDDVIAFWRNQPGIGLSAADEREGIAAYLTRNPGMSWIVRQGGEVVAAVLCGHDGRRGVLYHLAVAAGYRKRGIARALASRCIEKLVQCGIAKCNVFVYSDNSEGQDFWRAMDFEVRADLKLMQKQM
jgi:ribosomal protein S18 acetylase RimI-like enzyme